jgi:hypothetical protein
VNNPTSSFLINQLRPYITPNLTAWDLDLDDQYKYSQKFPVGSAGHQKLVDIWYEKFKENRY